MVSLSTIASSIFYISVLILLFVLMTNSSKRIIKFGVPLLVAFAAAIIIRGFIPYEFAFTRNILSYQILPAIDSFFRYTLFEIGVYHINLYGILGTVWLSGIIVHFAKLIYRHCKYVFSTKMLEDVTASKRIQSTLMQIDSEIKAPHSSKILLDYTATTPSLLGFFRPTIILPSLDYSDEDLFFYIKHELSHFLNFDIWKTTLCELLCCVIWWNPLVTKCLRKRVRRITEANADFAAVKFFSELDKINYLESVVKIAKTVANIQKDTPLKHTLASSQKEISQRVDIVLNYDKEKKKRHFSILMALPLLAFLIVLTFGFTVQPHYLLPSENGQSIAFSISDDDSYFVTNGDGSYSMYSAGKFQGIVTTIPESLSQIPVYDSMED